MQSILFGNIIRREAMEHIGRAGQLYRISYIRRKGCFSLFHGKMSAQEVIHLLEIVMNGEA